MTATSTAPASPAAATVDAPSLPAAATIYALSSGALPAGIAVVRVSGPDAITALERIAGSAPPTRQASLRTLRAADGQVIDRALVIAFPGPGSATGEDLAEFHVHGGPALVAALLAALGAVPGLRPATVGEFTRRAFDAGRLDLTQAEGLADLVEAETAAQHRAALAQSGGALRARATAWRETILDLRADAEAALDFAEAEDDVAERLGPADDAQLNRLIAEIEAALADAPRGDRLRDGLTIVVSGPPNVGKSSLVNALAQRDVALVSPVAGTTRDTIETRLDLGGVLVTLVDTAGLRDTDDPLEAAGIARARARAAAADLVLALHVDGAPGPGLAVRTKCDLGHGGGGLAVSSVTGEGMAALEARLAEWARETVRPEDPPLLTRQRQRTGCAAAVVALREAAMLTDAVLRAELLRQAGDALGELLGVIGIDAVHDRIFARFCIGK